MATLAGRLLSNFYRVMVIVIIMTCLVDLNARFWGQGGHAFGKSTIYLDHPLPVLALRIVTFGKENKSTPST